MSDQNNPTGVLLEDMNSKMDAVVEAVGQMQDQIKNLAKQDDLEEVRSDIKTIKSAVIGQSEQLSDHEQRINALETA